MRRTPQYFEWKAKWWKKQKELISTEDTRLELGLSAYADRQSDIFAGMARTYRREFEAKLAHIQLQLGTESIEEVDSGVFAPRQEDEEDEEANESDDDEEEVDGEEGM